MAKTNFKTVDEYFQSQTADTQKTLQTLKKIIFKAAPDAVELFNYDIASYALVKGGKRDKQIMIAGYKTFAGFYTGANILKHFSAQLLPYKVGKASV